LHTLIKKARTFKEALHIKSRQCLHTYIHTNIYTLCTLAHKTTSSKAYNRTQQTSLVTSFTITHSTSTLVMTKICNTLTLQQFKGTRNEIVMYLATRYLKPNGEGENAENTSDAALQFSKQRNYFSSTRTSRSLCMDMCTLYR